MGRLILTSFMTVDGVMEAPGFDEHRSGRNAWALRLSDDEMQVYNRKQLQDAEAVLLGRTTYQIWAAFWTSLAEEESFGRRLNSLPKYVVSNTLKRADWNNTTVIRGDVEQEVRALRDRIDGQLLVYGSADLAASLLAWKLVDELRLLVFPILLGSGKRMFRDEADLSALRLVRSHAFASGAVLLIYEPADELPYSPYVEEYAWTAEQVESLHAAQDTDRVLATVMFTDIVDSTGRPPSSATGSGGACWIGTTRSFARRSSAGTGS